MLLIKLNEGSDKEQRQAATQLIEQRSDDAIRSLVEHYPMLILKKWQNDGLTANPARDPGLADAELAAKWVGLDSNSAPIPRSVEVLVRMGEVTIPHLRRALDPEYPDMVRIHAAFTLGRLGPAARVAIADLQIAIAAERAPRYPGIAFASVATRAIRRLDSTAHIPGVAGSPAWLQENPGKSLPDWAQEMSDCGS